MRAIFTYRYQMTFSC